MSADDHGTRTGTDAPPIAWALAGGVLVRVMTGPSRGQEVLLERGSAVVGSHVGADLRIDDTHVSRRHAELAIVATGVRVKDLGSKNGTFVGETRIDTVVVPLGSEIRVGETSIALLTPGSARRPPRSDASSFGRLVGVSAIARHSFEALGAAAEHTAPVLLHGAWGSGKTEAAHAIHAASAQAHEAPIILDLERAESGDVTRSGELARETTLLLDRLECASAATQDEILALVASSSRGARVVMMLRGDVGAAVEEGRMRRELLFAATHRVGLPPLSDRAEDLPVLVAALAADLGYPELRLDPLELAMLRAHRPEDNLHGLRRAIERGLAYARDAVESTLPDAQLHRPATATKALASMSFKDAKHHVLDEFERDYVTDLLRSTGGNVSRAAAKAGLDRNHLAHIAKKHGLRGA